MAPLTGPSSVDRFGTTLGQFTLPLQTGLALALAGWIGPGRLDWPWQAGLALALAGWTGPGKLDWPWHPGLALA